MSEVVSQLPAFPVLIAGGFSFVSFLVTRAYYVATLSAKLHDRLFELNKLTLQFPDVADEYESMQGRATPYFSVTPPPGQEKLYQQLRAYTYFRLNLYEEAYTSTQGLFGRRTDRGAAWRDYIRSKLSHALARELFRHNSGQFNSNFVRFVKGNLTV